MRYSFDRSRRASHQGFTLVELLVVIGIIALLISLLLPSLAGARRAAQTVACSANMRSILQGMQLYAAEQRGFLPGSPTAGGYHLIAPNSTASQTNTPGLTQIWDWQAPIARMMNIRFNDGADTAARRERFLQLLTQPVFTCPSAEGTLMTAFTGNGGEDVGVQPYMSYSTSSLFLYRREGEHPPTRTGVNPEGTVKINFYGLPSGHGPQLSRVRSPSTKVYLFEGARFSDSSAPTYNLGYAARFGGTYSDYGAFGRFNRSQSRARVPGNGGTAGLDSRVLWARHGQANPLSRGGTFRSNYGFFDGHVETLNDLEGSNPAMFMPTGTTFSRTELWADTAQTFFPGVTGTITVGN